MAIKTITKQASDILVNDEIRYKDSGGEFHRVMDVSRDGRMRMLLILENCPDGIRVSCPTLFDVRVHESQTRPPTAIYKTALSGENGEIICEISEAGVTVTTIGFLTEQEYRMFVGHEMKRLDI